MTCNRCENIHEAQKAGKCFDSCRCDCHTCSGSGTQPFLINFVNDITSGAATATTLTTSFDNTSGASDGLWWNN